MGLQNLDLKHFQEIKHVNENVAPRYLDIACPCAMRRRPCGGYGG
jgi:hypothetical protein